MAKKEKRCNSKGSGAANQHAVKKAAAKRSRSQKTAKSKVKPLSWMQKNVLSAALVPFMAIIIALMFVAFRNSGESNGNDGHLIPPIDGVAIEDDSTDPERGNKTRVFLDHVVCDYQPESDAVAEIGIGEKGYCHPRLSAVPNYRTQRVSILHDPAKDGPPPVTISQKLKKWGEEKILKYFTANENEFDVGIPKGELVMRLPRPLQIWDLDALRDKYIQQNFLGLHPNDDSAIDEARESSSEVAARHKHTQNPLDSGAYLALHMIRLFRGSRAKKKPPSGDGNDGLCRDESGECKLLQRLDEFEQQHKHRISTLAAYLDVLPTVTSRIAKETESRINLHSHPLFWSSRLIKELFPPATYTYDLIWHYQRMIESEYEALKLKSDEFAEKVNYLTYLNMRVNVLSRAFGVPAPINDDGALWGAEDDTGELSLMEELRSYETSNFGSFLDEDMAAQEFKLRSMCPLLDMYNSHPNPNVSWRYDSNTSSFEIHATRKSDIPPGHSIVVSYGTFSPGYMFAKFGYVNGDGSEHTEVSLAVFHRMLGDVGLGRQYSRLPFQVWDPNARDEMYESLLEREYDLELDFDEWKSMSSAKEALEAQAKELARYLMFDDGYDECVDASSNTYSRDEELKFLKLQYLVRIANFRDAWIIRMPPKFPDAQPLQTLPNGKNMPTRSPANEPEGAVGIKADRIVSICRLLSLTPDDIGGDAIEFLREGLAKSETPKSSSKSYFLVEKSGDALEYRALMCVVRLCNVGLSRYVGYDNAEPQVVGSRAWKAWYITTGEVRALGMLQQTAANEAKKSKQKYLSAKGTKAAADTEINVREEGACPLNYTLPLLSRLRP